MKKVILNFEGEQYEMTTDEAPDQGASELNDLLSAAGDACVDFYMQIHISGMREQIEPLKKLWSIGQELHLAKRNSR